MAEQLAYRIKVGSKGQHHGGKRVPARVIGNLFRDTCCFRPFGQYLVYIGFGYQTCENIILVVCIFPLRQPFDRLSRKWQEDGSGCFLHDNGSSPLFAIL